MRKGYQIKAGFSLLIDPYPYEHPDWAMTEEEISAESLDYYDPFLDWDECDYDDDGDETDWSESLLEFVMPKFESMKHPRRRHSRTERDPIKG